MGMANIFNKSVKNKIITLALLVALISIVTVGFISYVSGKATIEKQIKASLLSIAESRQQAIILLLRLRLEEIEILAANETLQRLMDAWNKMEKGEQIDEPALKRDTESLVKTELPEYSQVASSFYDYIFVGTGGKVYFSSDELLIGKDLSADERFKSGLKRKFLSDVKLDEKTKRPYRQGIVPVFPHEAAHKEPIGVLMVKIKTEALNQITVNRKGMGETGEVYIVNKDGFMITESRFIKDAILKQKVDTEPIRLFQREKKVMTGIYPDYRGIPVVGASMGNEIKEEFGLGWTILAEIDEAEAFAPIYKLRTQVIILSLVIGIIAILISFFLSERISHPIKEISGLAEDIAQGKFDTKVDIKTKDEIGQLAKSFNQMVKDLKERDALKVTKADLEKAVAQRTRELKEAQEKLVRQEKLAVVGALSAGLGHELRNPLGAIKNAAYYVKRKVLVSDLAKEDKRIPEFLEIIENEINASDKIITDLLTFSRTGKPAFRPSEVNTVIDGALYLAKAPENIRVEKQFRQNLAKAMIDSDQIRQVFLNIILNAFQAMPEGGSLTVASKGEGEFIEVSFKDTGSGIAKENIDKIFEPLFTTKAKGIGLGLAVTKAIVDKHEGLIEVESEVGKGTTFVIKLPVAG